MLDGCRRDGSCHRRHGDGKAADLQYSDESPSLPQTAKPKQDLGQAIQESSQECIVRGHIMPGLYQTTKPEILKLSLDCKS